MKTGWERQKLHDLGINGDEDRNEASAIVSNIKEVDGI